MNKLGDMALRINRVRIRSKIPNKANIRSYKISCRFHLFLRYLIKSVKDYRTEPTYIIIYGRVVKLTRSY